MKKQSSNCDGIRQPVKQSLRKHFRNKASLVASEFCNLQSSGKSVVASLLTHGPPDKVAYIAPHNYKASRCSSPKVLVVAVIKACSSFSFYHYHAEVKVQ
jgi:hypothetical protein